MARSRRDALNVFVNAPFDPAYDPLLEAMVFMIHAAGFRARCALEENDSGDIRLDKLVRLIDECPRSIHDLSRTRPVIPTFKKIDALWPSRECQWRRCVRPRQ